MNRKERKETLRREWPCGSSKNDHSLTSLPCPHLPSCQAESGHRMGSAQVTERLVPGSGGNLTLELGLSQLQLFDDVGGELRLVLLVSAGVCCRGRVCALL